MTPHVLVLGAGSIGARHAGHLTDLGAAVDVADPDTARASAVPGTRAMASIPDRLEAYDGVVVASPSILHAAHAEAALAGGARVFVDKPLALTSHDADRLASIAGDRLMVGFNLRLYPPVIRLMELAHQGRAGAIRGVRLWFGSWMPGWRPSVDYRTTYSAQAALGGGVLFDDIHELDMLLWLLDDRLTVVGAVVERVGRLEIDVEDTVKVLLRHDDGAIIDISLDYLSRGYRRGIEIVGDEATLRLDWARRTIEIEDGRTVEAERADAPVADTYRAQMRLFMDWVLGQATPPVDGYRGAASVRLAEAIRQFANGSAASEQSQPPS